MSEYSTRSATERDLPSIAAIYNHAVEHTLATFDLDPPDSEYWRARLDGGVRRDVHDRSRTDAER